MKSFGLIRRALAAAAIVAAGALAPQAAAQQPLITQHPLVTAPHPVYETTPSFGNDGVSDLVTYTQRVMQENGFFDQGDIWYQRVNPDGSPLGGPVPVDTDPATDAQLNDTAGDYIVHTAFDTVVVASGRILLYQISTGTVTELGSALVIQEPRIHGNKVVWVQGGNGVTEVMIYDLAWLGTPQAAESLTGTVPPVSNVDIADRFVAWVEQNVDLDIGLYDMSTGIRLQLTDTPAADERHPASSGDWVVWESRDHGATAKRIEMVNLETGEFRIISDDGSAASRPSIDGDFVAYESDINGDFDVFLYRISTGETFGITGAGDQFLNDVWPSRTNPEVVFVAYVTNVAGSEDIYVARVDFGQPIIDMEPDTIAFGEVAVGESAAQIVTVTNIGTADMTLRGLLLQADPAFSISVAPPLPLILAPGETADVELTFAPPATGIYTGDLYPDADAINTSSEVVRFTGEGVIVDLPPDQQIADILAFFDDSVADGSLVGDGPGNSSGGRLGALRNMIEATGDYIRNGETAEACQQLFDVWRRIDGERRPPDFVTGDAAAELAAQVVALRNSLGCY